MEAPDLCAAIAANDRSHVMELLGKHRLLVNQQLLWCQPAQEHSSAQPSPLQRSPAMLAAHYGSLEVLELLLALQADPNQQSATDRRTPLHCAASGNSAATSQAIALLLQWGAHRHIRDSQGLVPADLLHPSLLRASTSPPLHRMGASGLQPVAEEEREVDKPEYQGNDFRMYGYKITRCERSEAHDWTTCPFVHPGEKARRRDPRKYKYGENPCPDFRKGTCKRGDACPYAHGVFEGWLHPAKYRTQICKDGEACTRSVCFFAHNLAQLRVPPQASSSSASPCNGSSGSASPCCPPLASESSDGGRPDSPLSMAGSGDFAALAAAAATALAGGAGGVEEQLLLAAKKLEATKQLLAATKAAQAGPGPETRLRARQTAAAAAHLLQPTASAPAPAGAQPNTSQRNTSQPAVAASAAKRTFTVEEVADLIARLQAGHQADLVALGINSSSLSMTASISPTHQDSCSGALPQNPFARSHMSAPVLSRAGSTEGLMSGPPMFQNMPFGGPLPADLLQDPPALAPFCLPRATSAPTPIPYTPHSTSLYGAPPPPLPPLSSRGGSYGSSVSSDMQLSPHQQALALHSQLDAGSGIAIGGWGDAAGVYGSHHNPVIAHSRGYSAPPGVFNNPISAPGGNYTAASTASFPPAPLMHGGAHLNACGGFAAPPPLPPQASVNSHMAASGQLPNLANLPAQELLRMALGSRGGDDAWLQSVQQQVRASMQQGYNHK